MLQQVDNGATIGEVLDMLVQSRRVSRAALRLKARVCTDIAGNRQAALLRLGVPAVTVGLRAPSDGLSSQLIHWWRKTDSNSRSLREGKGYGKPRQTGIADSGLNL
jgi:hypothetical protein